MTQDTRKDRRVKIVSLNVRYKSATVDEFIENHAHDVSRGGIFIKTANPFPPGTLLKFEIRLASDQAVIAGVGRIVWKRDAGTASVEHPAGMGVKFIKIDEPSKAVIDRLVNTRVDAGRAYEGSEQGQAPEQSFSRSSPPGRPSMPSTTPPPPGAGPPRATVQAKPGSIPPAGSVTVVRSAGVFSGATPKGSPLQSMPTSAATPFARKATIMGLGISSHPPAALSSPPEPPGETGSIPPPARLPFSVSSVPPRPGSATAMFFPKAIHDEGELPKEDQTVMRQAAELLEDALREAGGSMSEIGQNPLFSGSAASASGTVPKAKGPVTPGAEWTAADTPKALAATVAALRGERGLSPDGSPKVPSEPPQSGRPTLTSGRPPAGEPVATSDSAIAAKKPSAGAFFLVVVAAAAVVGAVVFRERLFGRSAPPEPVAAPPAAAATPTVASIAEPTPAAPPASTAAAVETPPAAASVETAPSASTRPAATPPPAPPKPPVVYAPPPRPRPVVRIAPPPQPAASASAAPQPTAAATATTDNATTTPTESAIAPTVTATSSTAPAPTPAKAKPAKGPDDNPY
jgi:uncharacterized protein (TIGR02266 family)